MSALEKAQAAASFIVREANGYRSRSVGVVSGGGGLPTGQILGRVLTGAVTAEEKEDNTGDATISAVTKGPDAQVGVYDVDFTTATDFDVTAPDGTDLGAGEAGVEFDTDHVTFTITAGAEPMVAGDGFEITVAAGSGNYAEYDSDAVDGSAVVAGILYEGAIGNVRRTIIDKSAEVSLSDLNYDGDDEDDVIAGLRAIGIKVR
jgi:hypothetical protein